MELKQFPKCPSSRQFPQENCVLSTSKMTGVKESRTKAAKLAVGTQGVSEAPPRSRIRPDSHNWISNNSRAGERAAAIFAASRRLSVLISSANICLWMRSGDKSNYLCWRPHWSSIPWQKQPPPVAHNAWKLSRNGAIQCDWTHIAIQASRERLWNRLFVGQRLESPPHGCVTKVRLWQRRQNPPPRPIAMGARFSSSKLLGKLLKWIE